MRRELTRQQFNGSYDWKYIFKNFAAPEPTLGFTGSLDKFERSDVAAVLGLVEGENDGADWVGVFRLRDGRFASITAGCDYTGWG